MNHFHLNHLSIVKYEKDFVFIIVPKGENIQWGLFSFLTWNAILGLQIFTNQCMTLKWNYIEYNEVALKLNVKYSL